MRWDNVAFFQMKYKENSVCMCICFCWFFFFFFFFVLFFFVLFLHFNMEHLQEDLIIRSKLYRGVLEDGRNCIVVYEKTCQKVQNSRRIHTVR